MRKLLRFAAVVTLAGGGLAVGVSSIAPYLGQIASSHTSTVPELDELRESAERSVMYDRDGNVLQVLRADVNRVEVDLSEVPLPVQQAILDVEDADFWRHNGVNLRSTARALAANVESGGIAQGGSTITQQLVKMALLTPERSLERKSKEAMLALRLEEEMPKEEILERYLNDAYFGYDAYGVQAAAETYFGVNAKDLTVPQGAFLAGIIRNPVGYDPVRYPELATERRDIALDRMVAEGHLGPEEAEALKATPLPTPAPSRIQRERDYFVEEVKQQLLRDERLGATAQDRYNAVFKGGLKIVTTIDPRLQAEAKAELAATLTDDLAKGTLRCEGKESLDKADFQDGVDDGRCNLSGTIVSVEPATGAVRAHVVRSDFADTQFNPINDGFGRQPGSSFKTFVLVAALENGYSPEDVVNGTSPCMVPLPGQNPPEWDPGNYEGSAGGVVPLRSATASSLNCAYARMGLLLGLDKVKDAAFRLGVRKTPLRDDIVSMSLGSIEVHSLDMASAYATLAADGVYRKPTFIQEVRDRNDKVLFTGVNPGEQVTSPQVARLATSVLQGVVTGGTGRSAALRGRQVAGKTGTNQEYRDAWFVGYTPQLSTAVWMGSPQGQVPMTNVRGVGRVTGGSYPAQMWGRYMAEALEGQPAVPFAGPDAAAVPRGTVLPDPLRCSTYADFTARRGTTGASSTRSRTRRTTPGPSVDLGGRAVNPSNGTCTRSSLQADPNAASATSGRSTRRTATTVRRRATVTTRARTTTSTTTEPTPATPDTSATSAPPPSATTARAPASTKAPATTVVAVKASATTAAKPVATKATAPTRATATTKATATTRARSTASTVRRP